MVHAAQWENWMLIERLCRESTVTVKQGKEVIDLFLKRGYDIPLCAWGLNLLFTACPELLRCQIPRGILALCMLGSEGETAEQLRPWMDRLPGREIVLTYPVISAFYGALAKELCRWEEKAGSRFRPVLRRDNCLPDGETWGQPWEDTVRTMLTRCSIRGGAPKGRVSVLAREILGTVSAGLVAELCGQGILFPQEDQEALRDLCEQVQDGRAKWSALLACMKRSVSYEL